MTTPLHFRTIWISDVHLGIRACKAEFLLDFLKQTQSDYLYLVGDVIDLWSMKTFWYWPKLHNDVVQAVLNKAANGTKVIYVPGNHDELFRDYVGHSFGKVRICAEAIHKTADGRKLLVIHGDEFDSVVKYSKWLAKLGSGMYEFLLLSNRSINFFRRRFGFPYWSLATYLKHKVKNAVSYISKFEEVLVHEAKKRKLHGVICGHIHKATIEDFDGVLYCNDGDWVESCTALVEHPDGALAVIRWAEESVFLLKEGEYENSPGQRRLVSTD
ncbi:MAG: UDP-2,3-diacylglucosamine diphosphatase [Gammaproteobacteria bacterium]